MIPLTETPQGISFAVRVTPRAGRTEVSGIRGSSLAVRLAAAPVDDAANGALIELIADVLGCPRRDVEIVQGARGRDKVVRVRGLIRARVESALLAILAP